MPFFIAFCWVVTILMCGLSAFTLFDTVMRAESAPQQAAGAAMAAAAVIIPYVFTRACQAFVTVQRLTDILAALRSPSGPSPIPADADAVTAPLTKPIFRDSRHN